MTYIDAIDNAIAGNLTDETLEKLTALKAQLAKHSSANKGPSKNQKANEDIKAVILSTLAEENAPATVSDLLQYEALSQYSNQKISALLRLMVEEGKVVKTTNKRRSYFSLA